VKEHDSTVKFLEKKQSRNYQIDHKNGDAQNTIEKFRGMLRHSFPEKNKLETELSYANKKISLAVFM
jgi:hypothetical protein